ncbi:nucleoside hydrolase [Pontibacter qinzhouensis]|uniref:Nucleoside hydrolase n=1 Tax=Pontibacter qinzhouensis TaxID=2603253 RepID=A0A5C8KAC0_9BACT|nr:nucleoside hydrolase [Pontibacter qinzhouensis]TXK49107.1 nucleoside hydrolase [Pontibacter qinzhouensis]
MNHATSQPAKPVLFDHDGGVDDFLSLLLLLLLDEVELLGVSVTPADCYAENALDTTHKLLALTNKLHIEVRAGNFHGINAFPADWRAKPKMLNALPDMINVESHSTPPAAEDSVDFMIRKLSAAEAPVTVLLTGPCSNLVLALQKQPSIKARITEVVWMGGAIDVTGNVRTYNHDGSAEWNVFWDPVAASELFKLGLPLTIVPLDTTNHVPVTFQFLKTLAAQSSAFFAHLAGQFWATTIDTIPAYDYTYFMWDVLTTSYLAIPEAFTLEQIELDVVPKGPSAGKTVRAPGSGQWVQVATDVDKDFFYNFLFEKLTSTLRS